jgi:hydroxyacylglutathione hydrolase
VERMEPITCQRCAAALDPGIVIVDARPQVQFKNSHPKDAINLMNDLRFETWLGSIINPGERFYLVAENEEKLNELIIRAAKIGYEQQIEAAFVFELKAGEAMNTFDSALLRGNANDYTIVDIRNHSEVIAKPIFPNTIHIPLHELRERTNEIPQHKPIVVHCAGGYRSAAGSSIIKSKLNGNVEVYDLSEAVKEFQ